MISKSNNKNKYHWDFNTSIYNITIGKQLDTFSQRIGDYTKL